jgi:hypothetical protein
MNEKWGRGHYPTIAIMDDTEQEMEMPNRTDGRIEDWLSFCMRESLRLDENSGDGESIVGF